MSERYPTRAGRVALAARLNLTIDPYSQDWEYEVAKPEWFPEWLAVYRDDSLSDDERFSLMEMLIQCVESLSRQGGRPRRSRTCRSGGRLPIYSGRTRVSTPAQSGTGRCLRPTTTPSTCSECPARCGECGRLFGQTSPIRYMASRVNRAHRGRGDLSSPSRQVRNDD